MKQIDDKMISIMAKELTCKIRQYNLRLVHDVLPEKFGGLTVDFDEEDVFEVLAGIMYDAYAKAGIIHMSYSDWLDKYKYTEPDQSEMTKVMIFSAFTRFRTICNEASLRDTPEYKWISRQRREMACSIVSGMSEYKSTPWAEEGE